MEPVPLFVMCKNIIGPDILNMLPETRKSIYKLKTGKDLSAEMHNMLEAMITINVTDLPWNDWRVFEKISWALNGHVPNMFIVEKPPSYYMCYAVLIMKAMNKPYEFSDEVKKYIAACLIEEGLILADYPVEMCQSFMDVFVDKALYADTKKMWDSMKNSKLEEFELKEITPITAQISKLATNKLFIQRKEVLNKGEMS